MTTSGVALTAATLAATASTNLAINQPQAPTVSSGPAPNTPISFNALLALNVLRQQNPPNARRAPPQIPHQSTGLFADPPDTVESRRDESLVTGLVTAYSTAPNDRQQQNETLAAGPAQSPRACRARVNNNSGGQTQHSHDSDSDESFGRSLSYLESSKKTLSPTLASSSQRQRVISPPRMGSRLRGKSPIPQVSSTKRCAPEFYGQAKEKKRKAAPAAPEKKKPERKSRKPPRRGLK